MKRIILAAMLGLAIFASPASAGKRTTCMIFPDPVSLSVTPSWTVTATGGGAGVLYEVQLRQNGVPRPDEGTTIRRVVADDGGVVAATFETLDYRVVGLSNFWATLIPGTAKVTIKAYRTGGGPGGAASTLASCSFTVVE